MGSILIVVFIVGILELMARSSNTYTFEPRAKSVDYYLACDSQEKLTKCKNEESTYCMSTGVLVTQCQTCCGYPKCECLDYRKDHKHFMNSMPDIDILGLQAMAFERGPMGLGFRGDDLK
ncbi:hypothetical protein F5Y08DRAFT_343369 [Xylaria arbuscula]|nr:hypothetical protein F5Y08DRAFT_343369 [Xylaria arbuscula]